MQRAVDRGQFRHDLPMKPKASTIAWLHGTYIPDLSTPGVLGRPFRPS
jgi:hypothetical protein